MRKLFTPFFALISFSAFGAKIYHYDLLHFPKPTQTQGCQEFVNELTKKFIADTGVQHYATALLNETAEECSFRISYVAEEPISIVRTLDLSSSGAIRIGTKSTLSECLNDLPNEVAQFKDHTGLQPWISYCYYDWEFLDNYPYVPMVEAFGSPQKNFYSRDVRLRGRPIQGWENLVTEVTQSSLPTNVALINAVARQTVSVYERDFLIRYYAKEKLSFESHIISEHTRADLCPLQLEGIKNALSHSKLSPLATYCSQNSKSSYQFEVLTLSSTQMGNYSLKVIQDPKDYLNFEECLSNISPTVQFYREQLAVDALTGFCNNSKGFYQIKILAQDLITTQAP